MNNGKIKAVEEEKELEVGGQERERRRVIDET